MELHKPVSNRPIQLRFPVEAKSGDGGKFIKEHNLIYSSLGILRPRFDEQVILFEQEMRQFLLKAFPELLLRIPPSLFSVKLADLEDHRLAVTKLDKSNAIILLNWHQLAEFSNIYLRHKLHHEFFHAISLANIIESADQETQSRYGLRTIESRPSEYRLTTLDREVIKDLLLAISSNAIADCAKLLAKLHEEIWIFVKANIGDKQFIPAFYQMFKDIDLNTTDNIVLKNIFKKSAFTELDETVVEFLARLIPLENYLRPKKWEVRENREHGGYIDLESIQILEDYYTLLSTNQKKRFIRVLISGLVDGHRYLLWEFLNTEPLKHLHKSTVPYLEMGPYEKADFTSLKEHITSISSFRNKTLSLISV